MFARSANPVSHRLARIAFILACVGGAVVASAGPLHRYAGLDVEPVLALFRYGFYVALAGVALGVATILPSRPGDRRRGFLAALLAIVVGGAAIYMPLAFLARAQQSPMLNDVSTDTTNPPPLVATLPLRRGATNPAAWAGGHAPVLQRDAYPDIGPAILALPPAEAFRKAEAVAAAMGWTVVASVPAEGRLEAVATSAWFGFRDDIVVRVRPDSSGSRVDIRSKSRNGESDLGVNAQRIREFVARLKSGN
jgi:uncharacterized protein (DUF1499 family)